MLSPSSSKEIDKAQPGGGGENPARITRRARRRTAPLGILTPGRGETMCTSTSCGLSSPLDVPVPADPHGSQKHDKMTAVTIQSPHWLPHISDLVHLPTPPTVPHLSYETVAKAVFSSQGSGTELLRVVFGSWLEQKQKHSRARSGDYVGPTIGAIRVHDAWYCSSQYSCGRGPARLISVLLSCKMDAMDVFVHRLQSCALHCGGAISQTSSELRAQTILLKFYRLHVRLNAPCDACGAHPHPLRTIVMLPRLQEQGKCCFDPVRAAASRWCPPAYFTGGLDVHVLQKEQL